MTKTSKPSRVKPALKKIKVVGALPSGAWHSGGKIALDQLCEINAADAKILLSRKQVRKAK